MQDSSRPLLAPEVDAAAAALPVVLFLLQREALEGAVSQHLGSKRLLRCLKALRLHPVVPLVLQLPLDTLAILQSLPLLSGQGTSPGTWVLITDDGVTFFK